MNKSNLKLYNISIPLEKIVHLLIYLYILMIPFQTLGFRFMELAFGLPEVVFLLLVPLAIVQIINSGKKLWIDRLDLYVFGWLVAKTFAGWRAGFDSIVVTEIIKTAYLIVLYMVLKWTITPEVIEKIVKVIILSSLIAALTGVVGFGLRYIGIETFLAIKRPYPYLIHVIQTQGFTSSPNMLASIIMIGILFQIHEIFSNKIFNIFNILILMILLIGFLLTFSKTIVCLLIGVALIWYFHNKSIRSSTLQMITRIVIAGLFIVYILGTHFIIVEKDQNPELLKGDYIAGSALIEIDNYSMYPSQYWSLKEISLEAISQSFPWGLGPGKFNGFAHEFKKNDAYSTHVPYPAPHCTYLGTLTENGLLGLIAFAGIIFFVTKISRKILNVNSTYPYLLTCLPSIFIAIGIEAVSTDVMNFRHYWILLVLLMCTFQNVKSTSSKSLNL